MENSKGSDQTAKMHRQTSPQLCFGHKQFYERHLLGICTKIETACNPKASELKIVDFANSVDPDEVAQTSRLIYIYTVCHLFFRISI